MTMYQYNSLSGIPYQPYIEQEVAASAMTNKDLTEMSYHPEESWLKAWFTGDLSSGDQTIMEGIVSDSLGKTDEDVSFATELKEFLDDNAVVTDSSTNVYGPFDLMQILTHRKELYNDVDNPLYDVSHTPILGSGGYLEDHASRILNVENIHAKTGWHQTQVNQAVYGVPKNLLIYYGWLNSFNSAQNSWNNELVAQEMARYSLLVFGDGIQDPSHGDYSNTTTIIARIKTLNPAAKIFGYVTVNQTLANFQTKSGQWNTLGVHGIFMDEAGYDYGTTTTNSRSAFNTKVDYVHNQSSASICFVNSWNMDHVIGTENDVSYPNSTWNPTPSDSNLTENDWYLLESFGVNSLTYTSTNGYEPKATWASRITKSLGHRSTFGINLAGIGVIGNSNSEGQNLFNFGSVSALMASLDGWGSSDDYYGASSAAVKWWDRVDVSGLVDLYSLSPTVQVDTGDSDVYIRYIKGAQLSLDFSDEAEACSVIRYDGGYNLLNTHTADVANPHSVSYTQVGAAASSHTHAESDITDLDHTDTAAFHDDGTGEINGLTLKATPESADVVVLEDSSASWAKKKTPVSALGGGGTSYVPYLISGLTTEARTSGDSFDILPGKCVNDQEDGYIEASSTITVSGSSSGANGLDTGSIAASTWYCAFVVYNPTSQTTAGLFSLSKTSPTLPSGYTKKRFIGYIYSDADSDFQYHESFNLGHTRYVVYEETHQVLSSGTNTSWTTVDCSGYVPPGSRAGKFLIGQGGSDGAAYIRSPNASRNFVHSTKYNITTDCPVDSSRYIEYRVTSTADADVYVIGFYESLDY